MIEVEAVPTAYLRERIKDYAFVLVQVRTPEAQRIWRDKIAAVEAELRRRGEQA